MAEDLIPTTPAADPGTSAPPEVPAAPSNDVDPFDVAETTQFSRDYVQRTRAEAAKYRTRAKELEATAAPYQEVFGEYDPEDRAVWFDLAKSYRDDPSAAAARMRELADHILKGEQPDPEAEAPLTAAEFEKRWTAKEEAKTQAAVVASIQKEAQDLGYTRDTRAYKVLLLTAKEDTQGDIKAAHELLERERQAAVDSFVERKAREADGSYVAPGANGSVPSQAKPIASWDDADAALQALLDAGKK